MPPAIPDDPPYHVPPLLELERARLLDLLASLDAAEWRRATRCPGWTVLDLAAHLLGDDLGYLAGHRDGHHGIRPPVGTDEDAFIDWLDEIQDDWVRSARRLSPTLVTELLGWTGPQVVAAIAAEDPTERAASVSWASTVAVPRWLDHARELTERWIHRNQVLDALELPVDLRPDLALPVLEALRWAYPFRLAPRAREPGATVIIGIGADPCRWRLVSDGDGWAFAPSAEGGDLDPDDAVVARIELSEDQAWRLLTNNLDVAVHGRPATHGDPELIAAVLGARAIIGRPNDLG